MKTIIEHPKDQYRQFIVWITHQHAKEPIVNIGNTPEESLEDL